MDFRINDTPINPSNSYYVYQSYVEALLFYIEAEAKTLLTGLELFEQDSGSITASYPTAISNNQGLINRSAHFQGGKKVKIYTCPHINICHQDLHLLDGCKSDIRLTPQSQSISSFVVVGYHSFTLVFLNTNSFNLTCVHLQFALTPMEQNMAILLIVTTLVFIFKSVYTMEANIIIVG